MAKNCSEIHAVQSLTSRAGILVRLSTGLTLLRKPLSGPRQARPVTGAAVYVFQHVSAQLSPPLLPSPLPHPSLFLPPICPPSHPSATILLSYLPLSLLVSPGPGPSGLPSRPPAHHHPHPPSSISAASGLSRVGHAAPTSASAREVSATSLSAASFQVGSWNPAHRYVRGRLTLLC